MNNYAIKRVDQKTIKLKALGANEDCQIFSTYSLNSIHSKGAF